MKTIKKIIVFLIACFLLIAGYKIFLSPGDRFKAVYMVPENAFMILEIDNPFQSWKNLKNSAVWNNMQDNSFFAEINKEIQSADSMIKENKLLFRLFGSREILVSAHKMNRDDYSVFLVADMRRLSKLTILKNYLLNLDNSEYVVSRRNYAGNEIYEIYDKKEHEMLYVSFVENLLLLAYNNNLLEKSLDQYELPVLGRNENFIEISNQVQGNSQIRFYLNFKYLDKIFSQVDANKSNTYYSFMKSLYFGGWELDINDKLLDLQGYINGNDSTPAYFNALKGVGKGGEDLYKVIPSRSFLFVHLGIGSFKRFISNMEENIKKEGLYEDYEQNRKKIEKLIEINIEDNFISWFGDEMAILNLGPKYGNSNSEYALLIKANNKYDAIRNLSFVNSQIKKNTPVKFNTINYKGYDINYLSISGVFKLLLGKMFNRLDKPYYTIFDNVIIFSNHPQTIKNIIDDIHNNNTIDKSDGFNNFKTKHFNENPNIFIFINSSPLVKNVKSALVYQYQNGIAKNSSFFDQLPLIGIELENKKNMFYSHLIIQYNDSSTDMAINHISIINDMEIENIINDSNITDTAIKTITGNDDNITDPFVLPEIPINDLQANKYIEHFDDGAVKTEIEIISGIKNGDYVQYHSNGRVKLKGKFKNDRQSGVWRYYDMTGRLISKKKFD